MIKCALYTPSHAAKADFTGFLYRQLKQTAINSQIVFLCYGKMIGGSAGLKKSPGSFMLHHYSLNELQLALAN